MAALYLGHAVVEIRDGVDRLAAGCDQAFDDALGIGGLVEVVKLDRLARRCDELEDAIGAVVNELVMSPVAGRVIAARRIEPDGVARAAHHQD